MKIKKLKKQFGGGVQNLISPIKPWEFKPFYEKSDNAPLIQISNRLQDVYDKRLETKEAQAKAIRELKLNPNLYKDFQYKLQDDYTNEMSRALSDVDGLITSHSFGQDLTNIATKFLINPELKVASYNTEEIKTWQDQVREMEKEGIYLKELDPNKTAYDEHFIRDKKIFDPWSYAPIIPFNDYTKTLMDFVKGLPLNQDIYVSAVSSYDAWYQKVESLDDGKIAGMLDTYKEGFYNSIAGGNFKSFVANKHGFQKDKNGSVADSEMKNGKSFKAYLDDEYAFLVNGIAKGLQVVKKTDIGNLSRPGQLAYDKSVDDANNAANKKKSDEQKAAEQKAKEDAEAKKVTGLFPENAIHNSYPIYDTKSGIPGNYDLQANFNKQYLDFEKENQDAKQFFTGYKFKDSTGQDLTYNQAIDLYSLGKDKDLNILDKSGNSLSSVDKAAVDNKFTNIVYKKNLLEASVIAINERDKEITGKLLNTTDKNNRKNYTVDNVKTTVNLVDGSIVTYKAITDQNTRDQLWLVTDPSKGYVDVIISPAEFISMYPIATSNNVLYTKQIEKELFQLEQKVKENMNSAQNEWLRRYKNINDPAKITPEMISEYRASEYYKDLLEKSKKDVLKEGISELHKNYISQKLQYALNPSTPYGALDDKYTVLPIANRSSTRENDAYLNSVILNKENNKDSQKYYDLYTNSYVTWNDILKEWTNIPYKEGTVYGTYKLDNLPVNTIHIAGYDMNNKVGGVFVAQIGYDMKIIRDIYSKDSESGGTLLTDIQNKLEEAVSSGLLQKIDGTDKYVFAEAGLKEGLKHGTYLIKDPYVAEQYFKTYLADDNTTIKKSTDVYNTIIDRFNDGQSVVVMPAANDTNVVFKNHGAEGYSFNYNDLNGEPGVISTSNLEEAVDKYIRYNQTILMANSALEQNPYISNQKVVSGLNYTAKNVLSNTLDKIVNQYTTSARSSAGYNSNLDGNKDSLLLNSVPGSTNQLKFTYNDNNYPARSILSVLRQIASVTSINPDNTLVYNAQYTSLTPSNKSDLSTLTTYPPINLQNQTQKMLLEQIFGTSNLQISYPDNGDSEYITITLN